MRIVAPQPLVQIRPDIWMPVDGLGYQLAPNLDTTINTGEGSVRLLTDEKGHRIGLQGPPNGERKILAVGDSFLEGLQVEYEELVTTRLGGLLEGHAATPRIDRNASYTACRGQRRSDELESQSLLPQGARCTG